MKLNTDESKAANMGIKHFQLYIYAGMIFELIIIILERDNTIIPEL